MENENTIKRSCSYSCSSEESDERPPFSQGLDYESSGADISGEGEGCSSSSSSSLTFSRGGTRRADVASSSDGWPESSSSAASATPFAFAGGRDTVIWEETKDRLNSQLSAMDMMKERFSKLLLGEDMSGCGKGVCSALAISNAITNLAASVFGEVWRLEPLSPARKSTWRREMEWMLSVTDSIVELIPTWQQDAEGSCLEVMISRPRSDLYINLPALKKLDAMLLEIFDSFTDTEFWYVDGGILLEDINNDASDPPRRLMQHQQDKWWLPVPRVPKTGLSECSRKQLQHHRECTGQILKAAVSINSTILSEMEVPSGYLDSLPKTGRDCLGDIIYRYITAEQFSPECLLDCLDLSSEHHILDIANRIEAAIHVWKQKAASTHINKGKPNRTRAKSSWRKVRILVGGFERRALLLERAESLLLTLKLRFPGLSQTVLDMNKIQDNKDVGYSILESYSRVLESLAFNIIARIDDLIYADDIAKNDLQNKLSALSMVSTHLSKDNMPSSSTHATPFATPSFSPAFIASPGRASDSVFNCNKYSTQINSQSKRLTDFLGARNADSNRRPDEISRIRKSVLAELGKAWSYAENIENRKFFFKSSSP